MTKFFGMRALYLIGRSLQILGMWILLVDIVTAGPLGPGPKLFALGVAVFLAGWAIVRGRTGKSA